MRPKDSAGQAERLRARAEEMQQVCAVKCANYNVKAREGLMHRSAMEVLRLAFDGDDPLMISRKLPAYKAGLMSIMSNHFTGTVRGDQIGRAHV